jgi:hypothetical protein
MMKSDAAKRYLAELGRKYLWWDPVGDESHPENRIVAQAMDFGTFDDIVALEQTVGKKRLAEVMLRAERGWSLTEAGPPLDFDPGLRIAGDKRANHSLETLIGLSMASNRSRSNPKTKSMTSAPTRAQRFALFGPPPLLEGEDAALYDDLVGRMCAAVKPVDIIDELYVADVVSLEWEILRWRRLKFSLLQTSVHHELQEFLNQRLDYEAYAEDFAQALAEILAEILQESPQKDLADEAKELAYRCAQSQPDAVTKVRLRLEAAGLDADQILEQAKVQRAEGLAQEYARREPKAIKLVSELLASSGRTMHDLVPEALLRNLDEIERIDRLITIAETRRNVSLREIDRRRAVLGEALRRNLQEVEEGEFEVIETMPAEGQSPVQARRESRTATDRTHRRPAVLKSLR